MKPLHQDLQKTPHEQQAPFTKTERLTGVVSVFHVSRKQVAVPFLRVRWMGRFVSFVDDRLSTRINRLQKEFRQN